MIQTIDLKEFLFKYYLFVETFILANGKLEEMQPIFAK